MRVSESAWEFEDKREREWTRVKLFEGTWESVRVYESLRPNESETVELVATGYTAGYTIEHIRVVGQTRARLIQLLSILMKDTVNRIRVSESAWEFEAKREREIELHRL